MRPLVGMGCSGDAKSSSMRLGVVRQQVIVVHSEAADGRPRTNASMQLSGNLPLNLSANAFSSGLTGLD